MEPPGDPTPSARPFRVAIAPGVSVSKWSRVWAERRPEVPLEVLPLEDGHVAALHDGTADVAFVRLPVETDGLHVIPLWTEVAVVVVPKDHPVALYDEVEVADLVDEDLVQDPDDVPAWRDAAAASRSTPLRPPPSAATTADAVELVAAGLGVLVVPMSVARLHHRRDLVHRPVVDVPHTRIGLAWPADRTTELVEDFVGIVRGRTARSSRGAAASDAAAPGADAPGGIDARRPTGGAARAGGSRSGAPTAASSSKGGARGRRGRPAGPARGSGRRGRGR